MLRLQSQHQLKLTLNLRLHRRLQLPIQLLPKLPLSPNSLVSQKAMSLRHTTLLPSRRALRRVKLLISVCLVRGQVVQAQQVRQVLRLYHGRLQSLPATHLARHRLGLR